MRALISSYAFIRLSVLVLDFPHLSLRRHGAFTLLIWLFSLNCRQLKSCHVRVEEKGNEYGTPSQRGLQRPLVEFWGFLSPNHWKAQRSFDSVSFFSFFPPHLCLAWCARDSPNVGPEVLKMQSPVFPGCWTFVTSGSEGKLFVVGLAPCLADHGSFRRFWAEQRSDGKGAEWICLDSQVVEGKYLPCHLGRWSRPPPPTKACLLASESGHVSIRLPALLHTLYSGARISFLG